MTAPLNAGSTHQEDKGGGVTAEPIDFPIPSLIKSWNDRDAHAMAALYASRGAQIGFHGSQITGPGEIEHHLAPIFRNHPTHKFVFIVQEARRLGDGVGMMRATAGMVPRDGSEIDSSKNTVQTMLARNHRGVWKVELFQIRRRGLTGGPDEIAAMTRALQALVKTQA